MALLWIQVNQMSHRPNDDVNMQETLTLIIEIIIYRKGPGASNPGIRVQCLVRIRRRYIHCDLPAVFRNNHLVGKLLEFSPQIFILQLDRELALRGVAFLTPHIHLRVHSIEEMVDVDLGLHVGSGGSRGTTRRGCEIARWR